MSSNNRSWIMKEKRTRNFDTNLIWGEHKKGVDWGSTGKTNFLTINAVIRERSYVFLLSKRECYGKLLCLQFVSTQNNFLGWMVFSHVLFDMIQTFGSVFYFCTSICNLCFWCYVAIQIKYHSSLGLPYWKKQKNYGDVKSMTALGKSIKSVTIIIR